MILSRSTRARTVGRRGSAEHQNERPPNQIRSPRSALGSKSIGESTNAAQNEAHNQTQGWPKNALNQIFERGGRTILKEFFERGPYFSEHIPFELILRAWSFNFSAYVNIIARDNFTSVAQRVFRAWSSFGLIHFSRT